MGRRPDGGRLHGGGPQAHLPVRAGLRKAGHRLHHSLPRRAHPAPAGGLSGEKGGIGPNKEFLQRRPCKGPGWYGIILVRGQNGCPVRP